MITLQGFSGIKPVESHMTAPPWLRMVRLLSLVPVMSWSCDLWVHPWCGRVLHYCGIFCAAKCPMRHAPVLLPIRATPSCCVCRVLSFVMLCFCPMVCITPGIELGINRQQSWARVCHFGYGRSGLRLRVLIEVGIYVKIPGIPLWCRISHHRTCRPHIISKSYHISYNDITHYVKIISHMISHIISRTWYHVFESYFSY